MSTLKSTSVQGLDLKRLLGLCKEEQIRFVIDVGGGAEGRLHTWGRRLSLKNYEKGGELLVPYQELSGFKDMESATKIEKSRIAEIRYILSQGHGDVLLIGDANVAAIEDTILRR